MPKVLGLLIVWLLAGPMTAKALTLDANSSANNGGSAGWAMFFDLQSTVDLAVTQVSTASTAPEAGAFTVEIFTRTGSGLGGPVGSGAGSSPTGWTSIGSAAATQGGVASGVSLLIDIPDITLSAGQLTGIAVLFSGYGPRYFGTGVSAYQSFSDSYLTLITGDARSAPFTTGGSFFSSRGLVGSLVYELSGAQVPEPGTLALLGLGLAELALSRRRKAGSTTFSSEQQEQGAT